MASPSQILWKNHSLGIGATDGTNTDGLSTIAFLQAIVNEKGPTISEATFRAYESNDSIFLQSFIGCFGVLLMGLEKKEHKENVERAAQWT